MQPTISKRNVHTSFMCNYEPYYDCTSVQKGRNFKISILGLKLETGMRWNKAK